MYPWEPESAIAVFDWDSGLREEAVQVIAE